MVREVRLVDADLRVKSGHNFHHYADEILGRFDELGEINGMSMLEERTSFFSTKFEWMRGVCSTVANEAGMNSEPYNIIHESLERFETISSYLQNILKHVEADTLGKARRNKRLFHMR